jgi:hypothetical protein
MWLVASANWVVLTAAVLSLPRSIENVVSWRGFPQPEHSGGVSFLRLSEVDAHDTAVANLQAFLTIGLGFPAAAFAIGALSFWALRGFRSN